MRPDGGVKENRVGPFVIGGQVRVAGELAGQHPLRHGAIGDDRDLVFAAAGNHLPFGKAPEEVVAELMGVDPPYGRHLGHLFHGKVADTDGANFALLARRFQPFHPRAQILALARPVDVIKVDHVGLQAGQTLVNLGEHGSSGHFLRAGFGSQKDTGATTRVGGQELTNETFRAAIAIPAGRVKMVDPAGKCRLHDGQPTFVALVAKDGAAQSERAAVWSSRKHLVDRFFDAGCLLPLARFCNAGTYFGNQFWCKIRLRLADFTFGQDLINTLMGSRLSPTCV